MLQGDGVTSESATLLGKVTGFGLATQGGRGALCHVHYKLETGGLLVSLMVRHNTRPKAAHLTPDWALS